MWTEIYSQIKGSQHAYRHGSGIPEKDYLQLGRDSFLTSFEQQKVYCIFVEYERWRDNQGCYDLMDLVNHILR